MDMFTLWQCKYHTRAIKVTQTVPNQQNTLTLYYYSRYFVYAGVTVTKQRRKKNSA